jgi:protein ImuB
MRIACVFVPQIALQAALRHFPELRGTAVALVKTSGNRTKIAKVVTVSAEARRAGVRLDLTAAQATAACPGLTLLPLADADLEAADAALADLGFAFAPRIDREPARVFFEVGDLSQLYPSELAVTQAIQARAVRIGLGVRVAIAARKGVARIMTRAAERAVVLPGGEARVLAPLPLRVLGEPLPPETSEIFDRWGIATIGALAKLSAADIGLRLGAAGAHLHRLARGDDDEPFLPALPADAIEEGVDLDDAIAELEPLSFVLRGLFDRVLARLACRSLACAAITLRFQLDSRAFDVREVNLAAPTRETAPLLQLVRLDLTRRPPDAPVTAVLIVARPARVRAAQLDFLRPAGPAPDRLAATIARLSALCGPENVGAPRAEDTWREEAVGINPFALGDPASAKGGDDMARALTIRRYRPPEEIEVMWGPDGPAALRGRETTARILIAAGPYRLSGEWWRREDGGPGQRSLVSNTDPKGIHNGGNAAVGNGTTAALGFSRDYWDVHASDGALYRLHHDRHHDRWYLDGYYD